MPATIAPVTPGQVPFATLVDTILRAKPAVRAHTDWRRVERLLLDFLQSHRIDIGDAAGDPTIEIVRYHEGDEVDTTRVSLERLARYLADEIK